MLIWGVLKCQNLKKNLFARNAPKSHLGVSHDQNLHIWGVKNAHFRGVSNDQNLHILWAKNYKQFVKKLKKLVLPQLP